MLARYEMPAVASVTSHLELGSLVLLSDATAVPIYSSILERPSTCSGSTSAEVRRMTWPDQKP